MIVLGFLLLAGLLLLFYYFSRGLGLGDLTGRWSKDLDPLQIARRRYANGEITKEEFDRIREDLKK